MSEQKEFTYMGKRIRPPEYKEWSRKHEAKRRKKDSIGYLLRQAKYRAKLKGIEFSITKDELIVPEICPIMEIPLFFTEGRRGPNSFSIDRVDNSVGYTKENTRIISFLANSRKGDLTLEQVEKLLLYMKGLL